MVTAFILINIEGSDVRKIAQGLLEITGVTEVYPVAGEYDLIAVVRVLDNATLSHIIMEEIVHKTGVALTKTLFALDAFAKVDLKSIFKNV